MRSVLNEKLGKELGLRMLINFVLFYLPSLPQIIFRRGLCNSLMPSGRVWQNGVVNPLLGWRRKPEVQDRRDLVQVTRNLMVIIVSLISSKGSKRMNTLTQTNTNLIRRGFTLIEILIVVVILGILAAVVVPQFTNAADDANDAAVRTQLQTLRGQIELYRAQNSADPDLLGTGWVDMIDGDYLMGAPSNPLSSSSTVAAAAGAGVGWVWRAKSGSNPTLALYATAADGTEFSE